MGDDEAPTEFAGVATDDTELSYAWSADDGEEWEPPRRSWRPVILAVAASLFVAGVAGGIAVEHLRPDPDVVVADTPVSAAPEPTVAPDPEPSATFVADVPDARKVIPPPPPKPVVIDYDARFVANLKARGYSVRNPGVLISNAVGVCGLLRQGYAGPAVAADLDGSTDQTLAEANMFVQTVMDTYPGCG